MTKDQERIAELEKELNAVQTEEANGKNPELMAQATKYARQAWWDIQPVLDQIGLEVLEANNIDIAAIKAKLIERKYDSLAGTNKTVTSW